MKINVLKVSVPLLLFFLPTSLLAQTNVMEDYNGDFESGTFDHWRFVEVADSAAGSYAEIVDDSFSGDHAAQITWKSGAAGIVDLVLDNWGTGVEVVAGNTYSLNAAVCAIDKSGMLLHVTLGFFNSGGGVINESTVNWPLADSYEVKEHANTAPVGAVNCWIAFRLFAENGSRWPSEQVITLIDDVQLWETEAEATTSTEKSLKNTIRVYPNPVQDYLHILSHKKIVNIEVYNIHGQLMKTFTNQESTILMADLSAGLYLLKVNFESESFIQTIIKQ